MECRVCGTQCEAVEILRGKEKDVTTLYKNPYTAPKQTVELFRCPNCTHMQIRWMNPENYYEDYALIADVTAENGLGRYTDAAVEYYKSKYEQLASYAKSHGRIFDIGCGAGVLMEAQAEYFAETLGIEPSKVQFDIARKQGRNVINAYFSKELNLEPGFSAFTSTAVFEHVETIKEMLAYAYDLLEYGGVGLIEVPNGQKMFFEQCYYDVFSDHVNYFTPLSLCMLAGKAGFEVICSEEEFNRNHIAAFVRKPFHERMSLSESMERDKEVLRSLIHQNEKIGIWGVGAKARSFIQLIDHKDSIRHIWDVNAVAWNHYLDSTDVAVSKPNKEEARECGCILIFAAAFTDEIISTLEKYGYGGDVVRFDGTIRRVSMIR